MSNKVLESKAYKIENNKMVIYENGTQIESANLFFKNNNRSLDLIFNDGGQLSLKKTD